MLQFDFSGRTAFVTGAASGIGREVARLLSNAKAGVTCADLQVKGAQATADLIKASGGNAIALSLDVADSASVKAAMVEAEKNLGPIDCLVNCAGIIDMQPVENIDDAT